MILKKAQRTAKNDIVMVQPFQKAQYELKEKRAFSLLEVKNELTLLNAKYKNEKTQIKEPKNIT